VRPATSRRRLTLALLVCCATLSWKSGPRPGGEELVSAPVLAAAHDARDPSVEEIRSRIARYHTGLAEFEIERLAETILSEARARGVSPSLVLAVIQIESGYYNFAVSPVGALGLMQIMPPTGEMLARELGVAWRGPQTLFDPIVNVKLGVAYLAWLHREYGNLSTALAAYNWGPGHVSRRLAEGLPVPHVYARDVIDAYGVHAARLEGFRTASTASGSALTSAATNASTASIAASSATR
jgi:soluble lytic murein transglycosylase-like protein